MPSTSAASPLRRTSPPARFAASADKRAFAAVPGMADLSTEAANRVGDGMAVAEVTAGTTRVMNIPEKLGAAVHAHRRIFVAVVVALSVMAWTAVGASAWFIRGVVTG